MPPRRLLLSRQDNYDYYGQPGRRPFRYLCADDRDAYGKEYSWQSKYCVQNMTGAGHIVAANFVYTVAKPDGLTLLAPNPNLYIDQLIGRAEIKFDWAKFAWIGNASRTTDLLYMRSDTPSKRWKTYAMPRSCPNAARREPARPDTWCQSC